MRDIEELNPKQKIQNIRGQINQKYKFFYENIMKVIDKNAPLKKLTKEELKRSKKPWITKGILTSIKKKIYSFQKDYKIKKINHLIRKSKKKYYWFLPKSSTVYEKTWKQVNSIIHKGKNKDVKKQQKGLRVYKNSKRVWEWPLSHSKLLQWLLYKCCKKLSRKNQNQT